MEEICKTCYYSRGKKCSIMHSPIPGCWADKEEAERRAQAVRRYNQGRWEGDESGGKERKKPVAEKLDESFMTLYDKKLNDEQIAKELDVSWQSVRDYRRAKALPANKKRRSAGTVAASR